MLVTRVTRMKANNTIPNLLIYATGPTCMTAFAYYSCTQQKTKEYGVRYIEENAIKKNSDDTGTIPNFLNFTVAALTR